MYIVVAIALSVLCARSIYPIFRPLLSRFLSPLRHLPGPPSVSLVWGNVKQIEENTTTLHSRWIAQYGKVFKFHAEFGVSIRPMASTESTDLPSVAQAVHR